MHHKRKRAKKRARCYSSQLGPRDSGGDGWRKGNFASRFRVRDMAVRKALSEELDVEAPPSIRVIMGFGAGAAELFRIPVDESFAGLTPVALEKKVKDTVEASAWVKDVRANGSGDVEVWLDDMLEDVRRLKGLSAVCEAVEHMVEILASRFVDLRRPTCPHCRTEVKWEDWNAGEGMCCSCVWDIDEYESERSDWADSSR